MPAGTVVRVNDATAQRPDQPDPADGAGSAARALQARGTGRSPSSTVAFRLLDLLLDKSMRPGDRLPGERALAETLGVGRSAVREGISALEMLGVVETRVGSGTYMRSGTSELLPSTLSWSMLLDQERTAELSVVRSALERSAAELAAVHRTEEQAQELIALVERQEAASTDPDAYVEADIAFHREIAQMGGNGLLAELLSTTRSLLRVWFEHAVDRQSDIDEAIAEHRAIAQAVAEQDVAAVSLAMDAHMSTATARILRQEAEGAARR